MANVSPVFKKEDNLKKNDRPFSILPHMSKAFESFLLIYLVLEKAITLNIRSIFVNECNLAIVVHEKCSHRLSKNSLRLYLKRHGYLFLFVTIVIT